MAFLKKLRTTFSTRDMQMDVSQLKPYVWEVVIDVPHGVDERDLKFHGIESKELDKEISNTVHDTMSENGSTRSSQRKKEVLKEKFHKKHPDVPIYLIEQAFEQPEEKVDLSRAEFIKTGHIEAEQKIVHPREQLGGTVPDSELEGIEMSYKWVIEAKFQREIPKRKISLRLTYDPDEASQSTHEKPLDAEATFKAPSRNDLSFKTKSQGSKIKFLIHL